MARLRQGDADGCPHEVLDPRDLKYCRNVCDAWWRPEDDPFAWRERIPFARWGLAELQIMGWPLLAATVGSGIRLVAAGDCPRRAAGAGVVFLSRSAPKSSARPGPAGLAGRRHGGRGDASWSTTISSAGRPCGSAFSCRSSTCTSTASPCAARVIKLRYQPGKFLNALNPDSALRQREHVDRPGGRGVSASADGRAADLRSDCPPHRLRSEAGADVWPRGEKFGMIKLGSRTELIVPQEEQLRVRGAGRAEGAAEARRS